jgi:hypothetical protein
MSQPTGNLTPQANGCGLTSVGFGKVGSPSAGPLIIMADGTTIRRIIGSGFPGVSGRLRGLRGGRAALTWDGRPSLQQA